MAALPIATLSWTAPILLVWNASSSSPRGLYAVLPAARAARGDMVIAWAPGEARGLADARGYLPADVPLVKRVAAVGGDLVCAAGKSILINGHQAGLRRPADRAGRPIPRWSGCHLLGPGDYYLMSADPASFDGRYFGVTAASELVGRAMLVWRA
jgi:conjugative transfer signal peptidase TraF